MLRASLDDFKRPWRDRHLYDRVPDEIYIREVNPIELADIVVDNSVFLRPEILSEKLVAESNPGAPDK